jgi:hypothetical protein
MLTTHPCPVLRSGMSRSYTLPLGAYMVVAGQLYFYFFVYTDLICPQSVECFVVLINYKTHYESEIRNKKENSQEYLKFYLIFL